MSCKKVSPIASASALATHPDSQYTLHHCPCKHPLHSPKSVDIFCRVIDNYGDIGVAWRLAKNLAAALHHPSTQSADTEADNDTDAETNATSTKPRVRLWVDDLQRFAKIEAQVNPCKTQQTLTIYADYADRLSLCQRAEDEPEKISIEVRQWPALMHEQDFAKSAELVIETFGCDLPAAYLAAMPQNTQCWLNLEYLSAEDWIDGFHQQPSLQSNGVPKYFYFPGFSTRSGGLLREDSLLSSLARFTANPQAQYDFLSRIMTGDCAKLISHQQARLINVFCYPHAPLQALIASLKALAESQQRFILAAAPGVAPNLEALVGNQQPQLRVQRVPFLPQAQFDLLLSLGDLNLVRGEDSLVRAHWMGKPFVWHIYQQTEQTHITKLQAWLKVIGADTQYQELTLLWNQIGAKSHDHEALLTLQAYFTAWLQPQAYEQACFFYQTLRDDLAQHASLSAQILDFYHQCGQNS
ncbi:elongation factor P maturation arginine rhamnosyltransferase EarP [Brackiella oedipodis]|uniref:elongation factor P maturation arginine rhamnosyltransferase EarP n=1 Tax=Brackiella oedipodis TaxID=124225 RepID=UPI000685F33C|nr:elongation factor P maturation arginine rhamnosyltransferase EarP [Brackiella oedipodis]